MSQMYKGPVSKKIYMPLFHVSLPKNQIELDRIFQITDLMGTEVEITKYTGGRGPRSALTVRAFSIQRSPASWRLRVSNAQARMLPATALSCLRSPVHARTAGVITRQIGVLVQNSPRLPKRALSPSR